VTDNADHAPTEIEATLRIRNTTAEALTEELAGWGRLGDLILEIRSPLRITDCYLDRPDGSLRRAGFAFRRREVEDGSSVRHQLTLKGLARLERGLGIERFELERDESRQARDEIRRFLIRYGVELAGDPTTGGSDLGLQPIQERSTRRERLWGLRGDVPRVEVCLDRVRFGVADSVVVHEELEIEALAGGDAGTVDIAGRELLRRLPDQLVPWPYTKLEIGRGLERMAAANRLPSLTPERRLDADGYRRLGQLLAGSFEGATDTAGA